MAASSASTDYYKPLLKSGLEVRYIDEKKGRGLFTTAPIKAGDKVFSEPPMVAMQTLDNRHDVAACAWCCKSVGSFELQFEVMAGADVHSLEAWEESPMRDMLPRAPGFDLSTVVHCPQGCGETYCSPECATADYEHSHSLLCVGPLDKEHPLYEFKAYSAQANEVFLLAAKVIANVVKAVRSGATSLEDAMRPYNTFVKRAYWDLVTPCEGGPEEDMEMQKRLEESAGIASFLLRDALSAGDDDPCESILTPQFFGELIGMFQLNQLGIRLESPIGELFEYLQEQPEKVQAACWQHLSPLLKAIDKSLEKRYEGLPPSMGDGEDDFDEDEEDGHGHAHGGHGHSHGGAGHGHSHGGRAAREAEEEEEDDEEDDEMDLPGAAAIMSPFDGQGLYALTTSMNHSCENNIRPIYGTGRVGATVTMVATRDIAAGEELTLNYTDGDLSVEDRQEALAEYGFRCECPKCTREKPRAPGKGPAKKGR